MAFMIGQNSRGPIQIRKLTYVFNKQLSFSSSAYMDFAELCCVIRNSKQFSLTSAGYFTFLWYPDVFFPGINKVDGGI